jgi:hypothetical protein
MKDEGRKDKLKAYSKRRPLHPSAFIPSLACALRSRSNTIERYPAGKVARP